MPHMPGHDAAAALAQRPTVAHLTSGHAAYDNRILVKECGTLGAAGYDVLLIAPGFHLLDAAMPQPPDTPGVRIITVRPLRTRLARLVWQPWLVYRAAMATPATVLHLHDPALLPVGLLMKWRGRTVVYDSHEDLPAQILSKHWIPRRLRRVVSAVVTRFERRAVKRLDLIVEANPTLELRFPADKTVVVANFPQAVDVADGSSTLSAKRPRAAAYVGSITVARGVETLVATAAEFRPDEEFSLVVAGHFDPPELKAELERRPGAERVTWTGQLSRAEVRELLGAVRVGLILWQPVPSYLTMMPTKLFEYMAAGIPVVASGLAPIRAVVEGTGCGLIVPPDDPRAAADALRHLLDNPELADDMGARGRAAVVARYSWEAQGARLVEAYRSLGVA